MSAPRQPGRVLVTGAGGFVGAALARRLRADGVEVVTSDLSGGDMACDLTDAEATFALMEHAPFDTVFHCGAVSGPMVLADRPLDIWRINSSGTAHILEAARRKKVGRVIVCSTTEVYGRTTGVVDETTLPLPRSVYAASKLACEQAMAGYVDEHGLDAVALRLAWIYGPGRQTPTMLETMLRASLGERRTEIDAHADDLTQYIYVDDAVEGLLCAARAPVLLNRIYNISPPEGLCLGQIAEELRRLRPNSRIVLAGRPLPQHVPRVIRNVLAGTEIGFAPTTLIGAGLGAYLAALAGEGPA